MENLAKNPPFDLTTLKTSWQKLVAPYQKPDLRRSLLQLANTLIPYIGLWVLMIFAIQISPWLVLLLSIPAAGFQVRLFIFFHDCGHGSFFKSKKANTRVGFLLGLLTLTPSERWWHEHAIHHATAGNLDKRGTGDVLTLTAAEYRARNAWQRFTYAFFRFPLVMFLIGPFYTFMISPRFVIPGSPSKVRNSVIYTNLSLLAIFIAMSFLIGWDKYLFIQLLVSWLAGIFGIWLFYVQHQFENTYWVHDPEWDYFFSAMRGASFYNLPGMLRWFSGSIGYHHIHHLSPRIPNYNLKLCHDENPPLQNAPTLTLSSSLRSLFLRVWDEEKQKLVSLKQLSGFSYQLSPFSQERKQPPI